MPHQLDPFRLAESGAKLSGSIPIRQLQRLRSLLTDDSGEIAVELDFDIDELGVPNVQGRITAQLSLSCQRCLESYVIPVDASISLAWVRSDQEADRLPLLYEPYLVETNPLILNDVIEDELLLALPQVPMHEMAKCPANKWIKQPAPADEDDTEKENPFSVLAKLKHKD